MNLLGVIYLLSFYRGFEVYSFDRGFENFLWGCRFLDSFVRLVD